MYRVTSDLFYGSQESQPPLETPKPQSPCLDLIHRQTSLLSPSRTWRAFERQDEALAFAKSRGCGLMTFVFHASITEQRMFLVAHPREFWLFDLQKEPSHRCSYEVIPEFQPCKLYFDLEFEIKYNPQRDGVKMTRLFIDVVGFRLFQLYHLKVDRSMILDLDSSTEQKFSRHLIYQIPMLCFANNYQVGVLVSDVCALIRGCDVELCQALGITEDTLKHLLITDRHGKEKLFCDEAVYSKNRHFRLYGSTKPRKNSHLVVSAENQYTIHLEDPKLSEEGLFLASLITNFEPYDIVVPLPERPYQKVKLSGSGGGAGPSCTRNLPSPFPILDGHVTELMAHEGIRSWVFFSSTQHMVYEALRPAYCGNVEREHRSNKGMLVVDLRRSVWYRKCHDPDCAGYQSQPTPLPSRVRISLQHPECTAEQRKEIEELLELLESSVLEEEVLVTSKGPDDSGATWEAASKGIQDLKISDSQQPSQSTHETTEEKYRDDINDVMQFLESQSDCLNFDEF